MINASGLGANLNIEKFREYKAKKKYETTRALSQKVDRLHVQASETVHDL